MDTALTLDLAPSIHDIPQAAWDTLAGGNPFVSHAFLAAVEDSGSTGARTGWLPRHAVLRDAEGAIAALAPMYVKGHSYGEYVFDHGWAHALERAGGQYYPKLQVASPFSPVPGPRLLLRQGTPIAAMGQALVSACQGLELSSVHVTFCTQAERDGLGDAGWLRRSGLQFHWHNRGYADFDAFLGALSSRKRKSIRRERRDAQNQGLEFVTMRGPEIDAATWAAFYGFYTSTVDRKWGSAYLTRRFFPLLGERLGDRVVLMLARRGREWVAGALNLLGEDTLYGRNWGASGEFPFLHFELCYYRAIDFAIGNGIATVEAGAQGEHKIQRGYLPTETHSAHWIAHPGLRRAVASFLAEEAAEKLAQMEALAELSPYRSDGEDEL